MKIFEKVVIIVALLFMATGIFCSCTDCSNSTQHILPQTQEGINNSYFGMSGKGEVIIVDKNSSCTVVYVESNVPWVVLEATENTFVEVNPRSRNEITEDLVEVRLTIEENITGIERYVKLCFFPKIGNIPYQEIYICQKG